MKIKSLIFCVALLFTALPAGAEIILQYDGGGNMLRFSDSSSGMPGIVMLSPIPSASPAVSRQLQRSHAWSVSRRGDSATGAGLVFSSGFAGLAAHNNDRQAITRAHLSRAHAFRLDYYK